MQSSNPTAVRFLQSLDSSASGVQHHDLVEEFSFWHLLHNTPAYYGAVVISCDI